MTSTPPTVPSPPSRWLAVPPRGHRSPELLRGLVADAPMISRWTPEYLAQLAGDRQVDVVIGERESGAARYATLALADVFRRQLGEADGEPIYLKEFDLLGALPALVPDAQLARVERPGHRSVHHAWISDRGARTGYHYDLLDNVLTQVRGRKRATLVPPELGPSMYRSDRFDLYARLSEVDGFAPDLRRFPRFALAKAVEKSFELGPGDALFIPAGWWHRVESNTPSISLAGFMASRGDLVRLIPEHIRQICHRLGLYKRGRCSCHRPAIRGDRGDRAIR